MIVQCGVVLHAEWRKIQHKKENTEVNITQLDLQVYIF
jgi:hypothetical protein